MNTEASGGGLTVRVTDGSDHGLTRALDHALVVGRDEQAGVRLTDTSVSRQHLRLVPGDGDAVVVNDLGSTSGTYVGSRRVEGEMVTSPGARIRIGRSELRVLRVVRPASFDGPRLVVRTGIRAGEQLSIDRRVTVGRDPRQCEIQLPDETVSGVHCVFEPVGHGLRIENRSRLGTDVNGTVLSGAATIGPGDVVRLGDVELRVEIDDPADESEGAVEVDIDVEGVLGTQSVLIETGRSATAADVARALARRLGVQRDAFLYRARDGLCPVPDMAWARVPVQRADSWILGVGAHPTSTHGGADTCSTTPYVRSLARPPRTALPAFHAEVTVPPLPTDHATQGHVAVWQIAAGMVAVSGSVVIAQLRPAFAVFAYVMAVTAIVGLAVNVLAQRARRRAEARTFESRMTELRGDLAQEVRRQRSVRTDAAPTAEEVASWAVHGGHRLWERRAGDADVFDLRIGTADVPALINVQQPPGRWDNQRARDQVNGLVSDNAVLHGVPYVIPGDGRSVTAVVGDLELVTSLGRSLLMQVAGLHAPDDAVVFVLATSYQWRWARWLPHATSPTGSTVAWDDVGLDRVCDQLTSFASTAGTDGRRMFVLVAPTIGSRTKVTAALAAARQAGATIVVLSAETHQVPVEVGVLVDLRSAPSVTRAHSAGSTAISTVDTLDVAIADRGARALAGYRGAESALAVGRVDACDLWKLDPNRADPIARWQRRDALGAVVFGRDDAGSPIELDFRNGSPHGVVAGTTGSGKSELLKTLMLGLCVEHAPRRLSMFLMDFKGGSTFTGLSDLPHVVGMVTDLASDRTLVERAFQALDAEIRRRKQVLDTHRLADIIAYEAATEPHEPMPALIVLIDEFALLKEMYPDLVPRLDTIAMQGRSLGIHLLLATQDPQQVITQPIRANTGLWLCLRVAAAEQSKQLLGSDAAAQIPFRSPGRGFLRLGAESAITGFQTARISVPYLGDLPAVTIRSLDDTDEATVSEVSQPGPTVLDLVADQLVQAARQDRCWLPPALWLPPLPELVALGDLESGGIDMDAALAVAVGLVDEPDVPARRDLVMDFADAGHVLAVGRFGSGKSTLVRTVASALCARYRPDDVQLYVIDGGDGSLSALESVAHVGAVIGVHDSERLCRLLNRLGRELDRRRQAMARQAAGGFLHWRTQPGVEAPMVVLLVDELGALREFLDKHPEPAYFDIFMRLMSSGPSVGIHLLLTASQMSDVRSQIANLCGVRLALELADPSDAAFVVPGLRRRDTVMPPGRADLSGDPSRLVQIAVSGPLESWHLIGTGSGRLPQPVRRVPVDVAFDDIASSQSVVVGVGGDEVEPVSVDFAAAGPNLLVLGESGSGRTTALQTIVASSLRCEPSRAVWIIDDRATWPTAVAGIAHTETDSVRLVERALSEPGAHLVVVDDAERLTRAVAESLGALARNTERRDLRLVLAGRSHDLVRSYDDWIRYMVSLRHALLLSPPPEIETSFDIRPARVRPPANPGRGLLVSRHGAIALQVARGASSAVLQREGACSGQPT